MSETKPAVLESFVVVRAQAGDDTAFEQLYESYGDRVLYYLRRFLGGGGAADDASQAVWLTVYRKLKTLEQPAAFRTWLYRIAHNTAISMLRKRGREVSWDEVAGSGRGHANRAGEADGRVGVGGAADVADPGAEDDGFDAFDAAAIHACLDRLSEPHREALTLRFLHDMSYQEIAAVVDVGIGTIRSRLHHAKRALRRELETLYSTEAKGARR